MQLKIGYGLEGFRSIKAKWLNLASEVGTHFLHYPQWYQAELEGNPDPRHKPVFLYIESSDTAELQAVIPLREIETRFGPFKVKALELFYSNEMGVCDITSRIDLEPYWKDICRFLRAEVKGWRYLRAQYLLPNAHCLSKHFPPDRCFQKLSHYSKRLVFKSGYEEFIGRYSKKYRRNLNRKLRKAEAQGGLKLRALSEEELTEEALLEFLRIEDSGWKGQSGTSIRKQANKLRYYQCLFREFSQLGKCQINFLELGGENIAAQFALRVESSLFLLKIAYEESHKDISPGHLLINEIVKNGAEHKLYHELSFVTGVGWIDTWSPDIQDATIRYSHTGSIIGWLAIGLLRASQAFSRGRE